jgi:DNA-binding NarL/FixJ family response regulator
MSNIVIVNAATGKVTEREATQVEIANQELIANEQFAKESEAEARLATRTSALAKLAALGLTEEEIAAL